MTSGSAAVLRVLAGAMACAAALVPIAVTGQAPADSRTGGWTAPKTPWGEPDLEGRWPVTHLMGTPLQRDNRTIRDFINVSRAERAYRAAHPNEPRTPPAPR